MIKNDCIRRGIFLLLALALHGGNAAWQALAQSPPAPMPQTRSCADYTPAKLITMLDQLLQDRGFWLNLDMDLSSSSDSLRARARELLARADAEERRESFLAEVRWVVKECGKKE
jgi:hypothetical protein